MFNYVFQVILVLLLAAAIREFPTGFEGPSYPERVV
jgi:hypothetical protein